ncbi:VOC family protein [Streptomyces sp. 3MP-14]|uniref:VOC family protein n=1 Tax=Streptomyces mimosae TaxID=2586635 RepID=A0A5N6A782_9ACTN|nr:MULTISPECIES: VOC family protein [Streptomyces]KAB8163799.1 VOC family protein [Streptomyces mimosae]KAB8175242.1 VOC family protein [Streptomyces sp. 3MP-14]
MAGQDEGHAEGPAGGFPEGVPCWADATLPDLRAGKAFYGELFGWTFDEEAAAEGRYTQAFADGQPVAGLSPQLPGQEVPPAWVLYYASPDVGATANRIREHGGQLLAEPMDVGDLGAMLLGWDPGGVLFGVWQPGRHPGFGRVDANGAFVWSEVVTRDPAAADAFFPGVFPFRARRMESEPGEDMDYLVWNVGDRMVGGRYVPPADAPASAAPRIEVYYAVPDCDAAVRTAERLGGTVHSGPTDSPFGRMAALSDPQGASLSVIDVSTTRGEPPRMEP